MGSPTFLNVTEKTVVLMVACAVTSEWIVLGASAPPATRALPQPALVLLGDVNEL